MTRDSNTNTLQTVWTSAMSTGVLACTLLHTAHGDLPLFLSLSVCVCVCVCNALIKHAHWVWIFLPSEHTSLLQTQGASAKAGISLCMCEGERLCSCQVFNSVRRLVPVFVRLTHLLPSLRLSNDEAITRTISSWKTVKRTTNLVIFKGFTVLMIVIIVIVKKRLLYLARLNMSKY